MFSSPPLPVTGLAATPLQTRLSPTPGRRARPFRLAALSALWHVCAGYHRLGECSARCGCPRPGSRRRRWLGWPQSRETRRAAMVQTVPFRIGADASCTDGACGQVSRIIVNPVTREVTHLAVDPKYRHGQGRLVPVDLVDTTTGQIRLRCALAE